MAEVLLDDVSHVYPDGTSAVSQLTLHVGHGEVRVIVGPSGCGTSTVLRLIAGLEPLSGATSAWAGGVGEFRSAAISHPVLERLRRSSRQRL